MEFSLSPSSSSSFPLMFAGTMASSTCFWGTILLPCSKIWGTQSKRWKGIKSFTYLYNGVIVEKYDFLYLDKASLTLVELVGVRWGVFLQGTALREMCEAKAMLYICQMFTEPQNALALQTLRQSNYSNTIMLLPIFRYTIKVKTEFFRLQGGLEIGQSVDFREA